MDRGSRAGWLVTAGALTAAGAMVVAGRRIVFPEFRFRAPTGPHAIGTVTHHWVDTSRTEILGPEPRRPRELVAQLWYPAVRSSAPRAPYLAEPDVVVPALARLFGLPRMALAHLKGITTNAVAGARAADGERFPVVVLLTGLGGFRQASTFLAEALASQGYVVVGVDQPYTAAAVALSGGQVARLESIERIRPLVRQSYLAADRPPTLDGVSYEHGIVPYLGADVGFVLDRLEHLNRPDEPGLDPLAGRLDLERVGVAGVSLGGLVTGEVARVDDRVRAALMLDAPVPLSTAHASLRVPCMWITRPPEAMRLERKRIGGWSEEEIEAHHATMRATFDRLQAAGYFVQVPQVSHIDFTDAPLWSPAARWLRFSGPGDAAHAHHAITTYALAFFERHLSGAAAPILDAPSSVDPSVTLEVHDAPRSEEATP